LHAAISSFFIQIYQQVDDLLVSNSKSFICGYVTTTTEGACSSSQFYMQPIFLGLAVYLIKGQASTSTVKSTLSLHSCM